jgi:hypothetical protein
MRVSCSNSSSRPCRRPGLGLYLWLITAIASAALLYGATPPPAEGVQGPLASTNWLNAKDFGASGSKFEAKARTEAGRLQLKVADPGDFQPGQEVMLQGASPHYERQHLWGPDEPYGHSRALRGEVEMRGYDGSAGHWIVYLLEIDGASPLTFRWSDDVARTWRGEKVPVTFDWQELSGGTQVRFRPFAWQPGHMVSFHARDILRTTLRAVDGNTITLEQAPSRSVAEALLQHREDSSLQAALDRAVATKSNLYLPAGHYRITQRLALRNAAITVEGPSPETTTIDISSGIGACFDLEFGKEVILRNLSMVGHTGQAEEPGAIKTSSGYPFWVSAIKSCQAVAVNGTERVLVENVHASRMSAECFYSQGPYREGDQEPAQYTKEITYLRCWVTDCAANAFNNNDRAENTSVLYCRINGTGEHWHAVEASSRFTKLIGNYVRNSGPFTIGDVSGRADYLNDLPAGQAIVSGNVFEGGGLAEIGIAVNHGTADVVVTGNRFINYTGRVAVEVAGRTGWSSFPARNVTVSDNIIEMAAVPEGDEGWRTGIHVSASDVIVSDNQVYVRGETGRHVLGLLAAEPAVNLSLHDNLIEGCETGILGQRAQAVVTEVIDDRTFRQSGLIEGWRASHRYRGWQVVWVGKEGPAETSAIESFDPSTLAFRLREPRRMAVGDELESVSPDGGNWLLHHNTITGCKEPVVLETYGGPTSVFEDNLVTRGLATGVTHAITVAGQVSLLDNIITGFNEPGSTALALTGSRVGPIGRGVYRGNIFQQCGHPVGQERPGLWTQDDTAASRFADCTDLPGGAH